MKCIKYLHELQISHNDIKLENIIYDKKNKKIKIVDMGMINFFGKY